ncbi:hypothetical protein D3C73_1453070 [compost metagenome]
MSAAASLTSGDPTSGDPTSGDLASGDGVAEYGTTGRASLRLLLVKSRHGWNRAAPITTAAKTTTPATAVSVLWARI